MTISLAALNALQTVVIRPECPVQDIGKTLDFTKSGATRIVNRLEKKGLVVKIRSKQDGRICCLSATTEGQKTLQEALSNTTEQLHKTLSDLPQRDKQAVADALELIVNKLQWDNTCTATCEE